MKALYMSLLCCLILGACSKKEQVQMEDGVESSIREFYSRWFGAMENEDVDEFLSLLGDDFYLKSPSQPPISDTTKLRKMLEQYHNMFNSIVEWKIENIQLFDDHAVIRVKESLMLVNRRNNDTTKIEGIHLAVLNKKSDGQWKLQMDVSSLNNSPPEN